MMNFELWPDVRNNPRSFYKSWNSFAKDFDSFFNAIESGPAQGRSSHLSTSCDIHEDDTAFVISVDVPGVKKEDIQIELNGHVLTVSGAREQSEKAETTRTLRVERAYGKFNRTFNLPDNVQADAIEASYENGVLHLKLPKVEVAKPKRIEIGEAKEAVSRKFVDVKNEEIRKKA